MSTETSVPAAVASQARSRAHLDVEVCTSRGVPARLRSVPIVRLTDLGVASLDVPIMRLRPVDEDEPAHFGANIALIRGGAILATITVHGEHTTLLLRPPSRPTNP